MRTLIFDCETNGLLDRKDLKVHCCVTKNTTTGQILRFAGSDALGNDLAYHLDSADRLVGHNICGFDLLVLKMVLGWEPRPEVELYDTFLASRLVYASNMYGHSIRIQRRLMGNRRNRKGQPKFRPVTDEQKAAVEAEVFPSRLLKAHSLKSWGYRLGHAKGTHLEKSGGADEEWSQELEDYCANDVELNAEVYQHLLTTPAQPGWALCSVESILVESKFGRILADQERNGVRFDEKAAGILCGTLLERKHVLTEVLRAIYPPFAVANGKPFIPKSTRTMKPSKYWPHPVEYVKGKAIQKMKMVEFNPGSGHHIANRLVAKGWKPKEYTDEGLPCTDEKALVGLDFPGVTELLEYMTVKKRLGQLVSGKKAWMGCVTREGLIHGRVHATGTRTSRCAHFDPNLGQVPKVGKPYGAECRELFSPPTSGRVMLGIDASGLELRMLASRLAYFDGGAFWKVISEGDPHAEWMKSTGIMIRDNQKTWTYASIYGAGDGKLGEIILDDWRQAYAQGLTKERPRPRRFARELGKASRAKLLSDNPALELLLKRCKAAKKRGYINALDGRVLQCRTEHGALNDVLQSDGAVVMKHAKVIFAEMLEFHGWTGQFGWVLDVHDEFQLEADDERVAKVIGEMGCAAIRMAGEKLGVRVPLAGEFKIGKTWRETH